MRWAVVLLFLTLCRNLVAESTPVFQNTAPGVRYLGSKICAGCHTDIYRSFLKTDMGHSLARMADEAQLALVGSPITVRNEKLNRSFQVFRKGNDVYQSEFEIRPDGKDVFRTTQKLEYVVGAVENAYTYVVERDGRLYEAPLSYYKSLKAWDLSPGYAEKDVGFSRPVAIACAACHSGRPRPAARPEGAYQEPPFAELAIACENCHGPGQLHVQARSQQQPVPAGYDPTIVNPQKLPGWLATNICMDCHEAGSARVIHPGKTPLEFRPGTALDNTISIFAPAAQNGPAQGSTQVLSHYQGMAASKCYRESKGAMACITCHDPHREPENAAAFYKSKCLTCHQASSCPLPATTRAKTNPPDNCLACHMGKKNVATIPHSALTDHRIVRVPDEPLPPPPDDEFTQATGVVHLDAIPGEVAPPEIVMRAYNEILTADQSFAPRWLGLLQNLLPMHPDDPWLLTQAGNYLLLQSAPALKEQGKEYLSRATKAGVELDGAYLAFARSLHEAGDTKGAIQALEEGVAIVPSNPAFYRNLIALYSQQKDMSKAVETARRYLFEFPQDTEMVPEELRTMITTVH